MNMPDKDTKSKSKIRPPVVVILGHVDHGKTSILDKIRETKVADREAGGITQHIGAYQIEHQGKTITFLDTPGHEAFSAIRARGAHVADVAILVIAAEEGIKPQTKESIKILKETKTPFVVAINKIDKEGANPMRVRQELAEQEVLVEDYGGQVPVGEVSAIKGEGLDNLLELVLLVTEMEELKEDISIDATGVVIEAHVDKQKGIVATLLVQDGTLKAGDWIAAGNAVARVKALEDFRGKRIKEAVPSQPCVVLGWESLPGLGQQFNVVKDKKTAEGDAKESTEQDKELFKKEITNERIANLIIKTDVQSSLEAIDQTLRTIKSEKIDYQVVDFGVGNINDNDIKNARSKDATIIGFNVAVDKSVADMAERDGIRIETSNIIYKLVEAVRSVMTEMLPIEVQRTPIGELKVLAIFGMQGKSQIVGGRVTNGKVVRGSGIDVVRGGNILGAGKLGQLQQGKQDVSEVAEKNECGIRFEPANQTDIPEIAIGDTLEFFEEEKIKQAL
ncbi:MAG: translation initiation factor IF-2 [Parcubacteria group bacterium]